MQNHPYSPEPFDPSRQVPPAHSGYSTDQPPAGSAGKIYPGEPYQSGQVPFPSGPTFQGQPPYPAPQPPMPQQPLPQQPYYPGPMPQQYPPPVYQPVPPPPPVQPNQTYVMVNNSQKVNSGCGTGVWITLAVLGVLVLGCAGLPVLFGGATLFSFNKQLATATALAATPIVGTEHNKVGQVVDVKWRDGYVSYQQRTTVTSVKAITEQDTGNHYLLVSLTTTNSGVDSSYADDNRFTLVDASGQSYTTEYPPNNVPPYSGELNEGGTVSGTLAFQIPTDQQAFTLTFNPVGNSGQKGPLYRWDLHL